MNAGSTVMTASSRWAAGAAIAALALVLLGARAAPAAAAPGSCGYTQAGIGNIGNPVGINAAGVVAAFSPGPQNLSRLLRPPYADAGDILPGLANDEYGPTITSISDRGRAAGWDTVENPANVSNDVGVVWNVSTGAPTEIDGYAGAAQHPEVHLLGINNSGQLVGTANRPGHGVVATRWSPAGVASPVDPAGAQVTVAAIADGGVIAGSEGGHAALFLPNGTVRHLGHAPGEVASTVVDVNASGQAVGSSTSSAGRTAPVYWDAAGHVHGITRPPGTLATVTGINAAGAFVGTATRGPQSGLAVLWSSPSSPSVLPKPSPPGDYTVAADGASEINDSGAVAGTALYQNAYGQYLAVNVWTPKAC